jgi:predicted amidohydrolase
MIYITKTDGKTYSYHIGQSLPDGDEVIQIQADGDELDHIYNTFSNIPVARKRVVNYFGDMAKFIVENW